MNPRLVVVFSQTVFKYLPNYDQRDEAAEKYIQRDAEWYATTADDMALTIGVNHPSSWPRHNQSFTDWHPFIHRALEYCVHRT